MQLSSKVGEVDRISCETSVDTSKRGFRHHRDSGDRRDGGSGDLMDNLREPRSVYSPNSGQRQAELDAIYQEVLAHDQQLVAAAKSIPAGLPPDLYLDALIDRVLPAKRSSGC